MFRGRRPAFHPQQVLRAPKRVAQGAVGLVEPRRQFKAGALLGGSTELVVVGMDFPALAQVVRLDLLRVNGEAARQTEYLEVGGVRHRRTPSGHQPDAPARVGAALAGASGWYGRRHIENDEPQPQVLLALGFVMLKPRAFSSSWKSTVASDMYIRLRLSMTTGTPWNSNVSSSFSLNCGSRSSLCWKPLQPPPTTRRRRNTFSGKVPCSRCSAMMRLTSLAAFSVTVMAISSLLSPFLNMGRQTPGARPPYFVMRTRR